jgi:hypothetical protein
MRPVPFELNGCNRGGLKVSEPGDRVMPDMTWPFPSGESVVIQGARAASFRPEKIELEIFLEAMQEEPDETAPDEVKSDEAPESAARC